MIYIYGLFDDSKSELVYVGKTKYPEQRLVAHLYGRAKEFKDHCRMEILESGEGLSSNDEYFWINYMKLIGCNLLNVQISRFLPRRPERKRKLIPATVRLALIEKTAAPVAKVFDRVRLIGLRVTKRLSLVSVARAAGVSRKVYTGWEQGTIIPNLSHINSAAVALGVKPEELITKEDITP